MRRLIMWNLVSLDGMFEGAQAWDLSWHEAAWGPELEAFSLEQLRRADYLLFGRKTAEGMAAYWSGADGEIADFMNKLPKLVVSHNPSPIAWNNTAILNDVSALAKIKTEGDGDIYLFGSADLSRCLIEAQLFDEYRIGIAPVVQGSGRRLFQDGFPVKDLFLEECRPLKTGTVVLRYRTKSS